MRSITGVRYSVETRTIVEIVGLGSPGHEGIVAYATAGSFNIPQCITIQDESFFPLSDGFREGVVLYAHRSSPTIEISVAGFDNTYGETTKQAVFKLAAKPLNSIDLPEEHREDQQQFNRLMAISATDQSIRWQEMGHLVVPLHVKPKWRWCSLTEVSPGNCASRPTKDHMLIATKACGDQMHMVTGAAAKLASLVKNRIIVEAFATVFPNTTLAQRIRFRIKTSKSDLFATEYVAALSTIHPLPADHENILTNLLKAYPLRYGS